MSIGSVIYVVLIGSILGIAFLSIYRNPRNVATRFFALMLLSLSFWILGTAFENSSSSTIAATGLYIDFAFAPLVFFTFYLFSRAFPKGGRVGKLSHFIVFADLVVLFLLFFSRTIIYDYEISEKGINTIAGNLYILYALVVIGQFILGIFNLIKKLQTSKGLEKQQIRYVLLGISASAVVAISALLILPRISDDDVFISFVPKIGIYGILIFVILTSIAIVKHKLLEIRIIILRTISYSLLVVAVSSLLVSVTLYIPSLTNSSAIRVEISIAVSVLIVILLEPLKKYIGKITDKLFYKAKVDYSKVLRNLSEEINREISMTPLMNAVRNTLTNDLKISKCTILLEKPANQYFSNEQKYDPQHEEVAFGSPAHRYLVNEKKPIVLETLIRKIEETTNQDLQKNLIGSREQLENLNSSVLFPVLADNRIVAIISLGGKLSGDPYNNDDFNLLQLLGPQLATALEKARLYEEIRLFNVKLQKEVEIATERVKQKNAQLEDRNRFLSAVQKVTNLITQTLEFKKVTQSIVDAIATELGFVGGVLLFLGESRRKVFPEAVTNSPLTSKVLAMLPKPINEYWGDYTVDRTLNIEAMKANQVRTGTSIADFISPPVPALVCGAIQKFAGIKTIVAVPVVAESEVVGCIDFMIAKEPSLITKTERDMMQAIANQTGVVYRNIELVRRLEESNTELGEANEHLTELDQAKSEFVSIASHQLRTPMTGIMGYLSMIVGGDFGKIDASLQKVLESLLDASQRMIRLINLFLDVTKIESGKLVLDKRPMQLEDLIEKELQVLMKIATDKGLKLVYKRPKAALPTLLIDDKITDVVLNLVDNAIKYTPKGSITITSEREGDQVHVKVQDTGRGLDPKEARGLFNKFVRGYGIAQVNPDGSGLGLYVARRIIEVHGGKIWVESEGVGKGSCFQFTLPLTPVDIKVEAQGTAKIGKKK